GGGTGDVRDQALNVAERGLAGRAAGARLRRPPGRSVVARAAAYFGRARGGCQREHDQDGGAEEDHLAVGAAGGAGAEGVAGAGTGVVAAGAGSRMTE